MAHGRIRTRGAPYTAGMARGRALALIMVASWMGPAACSSRDRAAPAGGSGGSGGSGSGGGSGGGSGSASTGVAPIDAAPGPVDAAWPMRVRPADLSPDPRPIQPGGFPTVMNPYHPTLGMIFASADGGCHVYPRSSTPRPPGQFPPPQPVECPPLLQAPQWGHCPGPGAVSRSADKADCICRPGQGDPPAPAFRMPCPAAWRCVLGQCRRGCVFPMPTHHGGGTISTPPPCTDQDTAFCFGPDDDQSCFHDLARCQQERAGAGAGAPACQER